MSEKLAREILDRHCEYLTSKDQPRIGTDNALAAVMEALSFGVHQSASIVEARVEWLKRAARLMCAREIGELENVAKAIRALMERQQHDDTH